MKTTTVEVYSLPIELTKKLDKAFKSHQRKKPYLSTAKSKSKFIATLLEKGLAA